MDIYFFYFFVVLGFVQSELINLKCDVIKKFVDGHNTRRLQLAKGTIPGQPAATKMNSIIWDNELAAKASKWASNNKFQHNPNRTIPSLRFSTGENLFQYGTTAQNLGNFNLMEKALTSWFDEHKYYKYEALKAKDFSSGQAIGHYTQMAWSDTTHLGCGVSHFKKDQWNYYLVVCNYGPPGNYLGQTPYKNGTASGQLTCGTADCTRMYGDSC